MCVLRRVLSIVSDWSCIVVGELFRVRVCRSVVSCVLCMMYGTPVLCMIVSDVLRYVTCVACLVHAKRCAVYGCVYR